MASKFPTSLLLALAGLVTYCPAAADTVQIVSDRLVATWHEGVLTLAQVQADTPFLTCAIEANSGGQQPSRRDVNNAVWGEGQAILIEVRSGDHLQVTLFESLPFAVWQRTLRNPGSSERVVNKCEMLNGPVDLNVEPEKLRTLSTGGVLDVAGHPGGYAFMAIGDPATRAGIVCGWLTHERGSGVVFSDVVNERAVLRARIDYGDLRIAANQNADTEVLLVGRFDDIRLGLEQYGDAIARQLRIELPPQPNVYCTWYHGGASDQDKIARNTDFTREQLVPYGFHVMQIDDKWQAGQSKNGPNKDFSKVRADGPYPTGMKATAEYITSRGLVPGIWFMPFAGTWNDPYWADKMDLFYKEGSSTFNHLRETNGLPPTDFPPGQAPFVARWGGTCLDMTNPKTQAYLRSIVDRLAHDWGYKYFKMDGLWTGTGTRLQYVNSTYQDDDLGQTARFNPQITPIEAYANGLDLVRETAGSDVFLLGCCAPQNMRSLGPAFGRVDAMRVGPDNGARPEGLVRGPLFSTNVYFLNKRVWFNDPDPVYVRPSFPEHMAHTSVSWTAITGSLHSSSYSYYELSPERLEILRRSLPSHGLKSVRPVDLLENNPARIWLLTDDRETVRKDVIGLFNWDTSNTVRIEYAMDRVGIPPAEKYVGFDFWANRFLRPFSDTLTKDLLPGGCSIIAVRTAKEHPQVISTSRHVTQGVVDLRREQWDQASSTLSGVSQVIGGAPYELRLVVPTGERSWLLRSVKLTGAPAKTSIRIEQSGPTIRVRIESPQSQELSWSAVFAAGSVQAIQPDPVSGLQAAIDLDEVVLRWDSSEALGYRVSRNGEIVADLASETYRDKNLKLGKEYTYEVQAVGWDGHWTQPAAVSVSLPGDGRTADAARTKPGAQKRPTARLAL